MLMIFKKLLSLITIFTLILSISCESSNAISLTQKSLDTPGYVLPISQSDLSIVAGERDYYTLLTLTSTEPKHGCEICGNVELMLKRVAGSWFTDYSQSNFLFFVNVDLADASNAKLFDYLELNTVPHIWLIPPSKITEKSKTKNKKVNEEDDFSFLLEPHFIFKIPMTGLDQQVITLTKFLGENLHKTIHIRQEKPLERFILAFGGTFSLILLIKKRGPRIITNLSRKIIYQVVVIVATLVFICGFSFTSMEKVPFIAKLENDQIIYISGGAYYQLGIEIMIVGMNYLALALGLVNLIYLGNYKITSTSKISNEIGKGACILTNTLLVYLLYSCLTSIYLRKDDLYPYPFTKLF